MLQERRQKVLQEGRQKILQEGLYERLQKGMQRKEGLLRRTRLWRQKELRQEVNLLLSSAICTSSIHTASTHGLVQFFFAPTPSHASSAPTIAPQPGDHSPEAQLF